VVRPDGLAVISSGLKFPGSIGLQLPFVETSGIYMFDFNKPWNNVTEFQFDPKYDQSVLRPHGIALYENPTNGKVSLFVVNHKPDHDAIEVFDVDFVNVRLVFKKAFIHPLIYNINDISPTGENSFYATIDRYSTTERGKYWEMFGFLSWGRVIHVDGNDVKVVLNGLNYANGVAVTKDNRYVYVTEFVGKSLNAYEIQDDKSLREIRKMNLMTHVDVINIDHETGDVWIGAQPLLHRAFTVEKAPLGASQVIRVVYDPKTNSEPIVNEVFSDNGMILLFSSSAAHWKGKLLIGSVFERLVYCEIVTPYTAADIKDVWTV